MQKLADAPERYAVVGRTNKSFKKIVHCSVLLLPADHLPCEIGTYIKVLRCIALDVGCISVHPLNNKLRGLIPQANYTD
jgi:hypothetical protein